jgi:hypothetical protein
MIEKSHRRVSMETQSGAGARVSAKLGYVGDVLTCRSSASMTLHEVKLDRSWRLWQAVAFDERAMKNSLHGDRAGQGVE